MFEDRFIKEITAPNRKSQRFQNFMKNRENRENLPTPMYKISNDYKNMVEKVTVNVEQTQDDDKLKSITKAIEVRIQHLILNKKINLYNFPASPDTL